MIGTNFDEKVAMQAVLYAVKKLQDRKDMHKIFKILYFADREHLCRYGRGITGDSYIAMSYGPVPSKINDIFKAVRGDSYFSKYADDLKQYFHFTNRYTIEADKDPDMDYLSETDIECLDFAIAKCEGKSFSELTEMSHDLAWNSTPRDREISVKDMLRENEESEEYVDYIASKLEMESA
ncbi:MAG: SocA family protein [Prevotellaceae bacterium]|nr:SocA family protein [Prevotellaceae bacterium]